MLRGLRAVALAAAVAARAQAQEDEMPPEEEQGGEQDALSPEQMRGIHGKIDGNGDGRLSMAEVLRFSTEMRKAIASKDVKTVLEEMDHDKDGKLSLDELMKDMDAWGEGDEHDNKEAKLRKDLEAQKFKVADANGDGFVDEGELPGLFYPETHDGVLTLTAKATMAQKDTDADGLLTISEFWEGDQVDGEELSISEEERADFASLDKDGSGQLDLEELKAWESGHFHTEEAMKRLFELADADNDMHVTAAELSSAREQIAGSDVQYHLMEWAEHAEL